MTIFTISLSPSRVSLRYTRATRLAESENTPRHWLFCIISDMVDYVDSLSLPAVTNPKNRLCSHRLGIDQSLNRFIGFMTALKLYSKTIVHFRNNHS